MTPPETLAHGCRNPTKQSKWGTEQCRWLVPDGEDYASYLVRWKWEKGQKKKGRRKR